LKAIILDNGKIQIPPEISQQLDLKIGDELFLSVEGGEMRLRPVKQNLSQFRGTLPATVPYPGTEIIRQQVSEALATDFKQP
jgi:bifunctional DNA-binding transcriptional regulator/antitoxin component of YhaV-PrlF toxin-antitoxin module